MTNGIDLASIINIVVWAVCILFGMGVGAMLGGIAGRLLGWMIATSMDANISQGGRAGKILGRLVGGGIGAGLGIYGALQATAYISQTLGR